jgi:hypothetical protein
MASSPLQKVMTSSCLPKAIFVGCIYAPRYENKHEYELPFVSSVMLAFYGGE